MSATAIVALLLCFAAPSNGLAKWEFYSPKWYHGDGTYYGGGVGKWNGGNCAYRTPQPGYFFDYVPVAMNDKQYLGMCGVCLEVVGSGKGLGANPIKGRFKAMVMDRCPECKHGDLDLAKNGDGRWDLKWRVIPCNVKSGITFQFEGSNQFYRKVQVRGIKSPAVSVVIDGVKAYSSQDNHWIAEKGGRGFSAPTKIEVWTLLGKHVVAWVNSYRDGVVYPFKVKGGKRSGGKPFHGKSDDDDRKKKAAQKRANEKAAKRRLRKQAAQRRAKEEAARRRRAKKAAQRRANKEAAKRRKKQQAARRRKAQQAAKRRKARQAAKRRKAQQAARRRRMRRKGQCVPMWKHCRGRRNRWGSSRCCNGGWCVYRRRHGHKCVPPNFWRKRCVPKYKVCVGSRNTWGTRKCCGGYWCMKRGKYSRCVPAPKCRRKYAKCGHWRKWRNRKNRVMGGRHCCQHGSTCRWVRRGHYACMPW